MAYFFCLLMVCLYDAFDHIPADTTKRISGGAVFLVSFSLIFCVWFLFFLAYYPGIFSPDSVWQLQQAMGDSPLSNHHPVIHTLLMRAILKAGLAISGGNMMAATAVLSVLQMLFLALCMAYSVSSAYHLGISLPFCLISDLFFALVPFNILFSFTNLKDSWFAGFFLLLCSLLLRFFQDRDHTFKKTSHYILFATSCIGIGLFRSNGLFVLLALLPFLVFTFWKKKKLLLIFIACLVLCILVLGPVYRALDVTAVDPVEYLSVPLQQVSRVIVDEGRISDADYAMISEVVNPAMIASSYYARISDNIKNLIRTSGNQDAIAENKMGYLLLWLRLLKDNPFSYINAYVDLTVGFWYPEQTGIPYVLTMEPNSYGLSTSSRLPSGLSSFLYSISHSNNQQSFLGPLFSCGGYVWLFLMLFIYSFTRKGKSWIAFLPSLFLWGTLLLTTPVYGDIRYIYAVVVSLPLLCSVLKAKTN
ncbi:MAG: hypothetical protein IJ091_08775 [Oscillospiraceae bacterium]|nr:hypothetical protein [Oscillospiraceae bacterium]